MALPNLLPLPALSGHQAQLACSAASLLRFADLSQAWAFLLAMIFPLDFQTSGHHALQYKCKQLPTFAKKALRVAQACSCDSLCLPTSHFLFKERIHGMNHFGNHFTATQGFRPLLALSLLSVHPPL